MLQLLTFYLLFVVFGFFEQISHCKQSVSIYWRYVSSTTAAPPLVLPVQTAPSQARLVLLCRHHLPLSPVTVSMARHLSIARYVFQGRKYMAMDQQSKAGGTWAWAANCQCVSRQAILKRCQAVLSLPRAPDVSLAVCACGKHTSEPLATPRRKTTCNIALPLSFTNAIIFQHPCYGFLHTVTNMYEHVLARNANLLSRSPPWQHVTMPPLMRLPGNKQPWSSTNRPHPRRAPSWLTASRSAELYWLRQATNKHTATRLATQFHLQ